MTKHAAFLVPLSCIGFVLGAATACSEASSVITVYDDAGTNTTPDAGLPPLVSLSNGSSSGSEGGSGSIVSQDPSTGAGSSSGSASLVDAGHGTDPGSGSGNPGDPEPPDMVGMTAAHNAARAAVEPAATPPLPTVSWSSVVAADAQTFTTQCVFADTMNEYGSNAFAGTGRSTPADVVGAWVGEDANYDYATNTCAPGQMCGHYTQVVWRDSVQIGCGMTDCTINNPFTKDGSGAWQLWVCEYSPAGNYVGEKPY